VEQEKLLGKEGWKTVSLKEISEEISKNVFHDKNPLFSIHIPRDYNEITHLLDQYEDADKVSAFLEKRMIEMSKDYIDEQGKLGDDRFVIPFSRDLKEAGKERSTEVAEVMVDSDKVQLVACEHNC